MTYPAYAQRALLIEGRRELAVSPDSHQRVTIVLAIRAAMNVERIAVNAYPALIPMFTGKTTEPSPATA
jgi:hypothetical protein